ncbi:de-hypoxanthine futalosine cyclase [Desulfocapsa sulfexigens DSM 10523]|uniref:Cyclic dehypoxanthine futalosine synthase n=1 Tax=Desulfocapsa sulfexigens (strain DSM 10523 / SB164P1) TaxID=1167006 RepID=M1PSE2_DESSD|nr:cyclic dehypoxanthinyl futalosine synthase [Desulfocapsa sulfexigens]AGF79271.1 de-hypoxanthine futalosine cyclase [Desulfocapsa sulfexigens DSM 10523]
MQESIFNDISDRVLSGGRLSDEEFIELNDHGDLYQLGFLANAIREKLHPEKNVTYVIDRNINYTDICVSACKFCAFFKAPEDKDGYVLTKEELALKIKETQDLGGTQILLQGGLHPDLQLEYYEDMLRFMKETGIHVHGFSPPEIHHFAKVSKLPISTVISRLINAGLDSIPGGGAEILSDRVRSFTAPLKGTADDWIEVMEEAHKQGLRTTATMMFGHVETVHERLEHLRRLRELQDRTKGFTAFIPWPFQPDHTALVEQAPIEKTTGYGYLRMLALSRIYLDNFENVQASWVTQGPKIAQLSLYFGANDFGSTMIEENVVAAAGISFRLSEDEIRRLVVDAGFTPRQRLMDYSLVG